MPPSDARDLRAASTNTASDPLVSIVLTGRNDSGGDFTARFLPHLPLQSPPARKRGWCPAASNLAPPHSPRYTGAMRSVADDLRAETARATAGLTPFERIALALRLGDEDVALYRDAHGVSEIEARAALAHSRGHGRRRSQPTEPAGR